MNCRKAVHFNVVSPYIPLNIACGGIKDVIAQYIEPVRRNKTELTIKKQRPTGKPEVCVCTLPPVFLSEKGGLLLSLRTTPKELGAD